MGPAVFNTDVGTRVPRRVSAARLHPSIHPSARHLGGGWGHVSPELNGVLHRSEDVMPKVVGFRLRRYNEFGQALMAAYP